MKPATILPGRKVLRRLVMTPCSTRSMMPSENISERTPRSCLVPKLVQHGIGDGADAHLQGRAVGDQVAHHPADLLIEWTGLALRQFWERIVLGERRRRDGEDCNPRCRRGERREQASDSTR